MYRVREQIGCNTFEASMYSGKNITVAILDTGIMYHPDFGNRILAFHDFTKKGYPYPYDDSGHGTHVAGCLAGNGYLSNGKIRGIAPNCNLIIGKVLDYQGEGNIEDMIAGIQWVIDYRKKYQIKILNISIGLGYVLNETTKHKLQNMLELAWDYGLLVIVAAGNSGPEESSISPLGLGNNVISIGCHEGGYFGNRTDLCEYYSGRGEIFSIKKKPDLVAPGTSIVSCNALVRKIGKRYKDGYIEKSGTSMSTPIVSGVASLILEKDHYLSNYEIRKRLIYSAKDLGEPWNMQGWGMVNVKDALKW
ncbi:MAG: S8 family peptidase [Lachnospiraceae bacterium]